MNIQIITTFDQGEYGACEALWYEMVEVAIEHGHKVEILTGSLSSSNPRLLALIQAGATVRFYASPPTVGNIRILLHKIWLRYIAPYILCRRINSNSEIRILNVGTMVEVAREPWTSLMSGCKVPKAVIVHSNTEIDNYPARTDLKLARILCDARRVYFVSRRLRENAEERLLTKISGARLAKNPVNLNSRELEPWPVGDILRFASVGRLDTFVKGYIRLLHALSSDEWKSRDWLLTIFGSGPDEDKIRRAIEFYGLQAHVKMGGFASDIRSSIWKHNHVLAMPSMLEGMPLTLIEAMVCGRPALCSDVGGASEVIRDGENGFLAGSPFSNQLAVGLERVWKQRGNLKEMGHQAHQDALAYVPEKPGDDLLDDLLAAVSS